jgi:hypothetical protein
MIRATVAVLVLAAICCEGQSNRVLSDAARVPPQEAHHFLELICPGNASADGCAVCPPEMPQSSQNWQLRTITFGHFQAPNSEDALVAGVGCEDHANLMSGAYLLTKQGPSWRKVRYEPGQNADDCKKLPGSDGRDRLVCLSADMHQGFSDSFLYLMDPGRAPGKPEDNSLDVFLDVTDSLGSCVALPDGTVLSGKIESVSFAPSSEPHTVRITVDTRLGKAVIPEKIMSACSGSASKPKLTVATVAQRYEFLFDGQKTVPLPGNPMTQNGTTDAPITSYHSAR